MINHFLELKTPFVIENMTMKQDDSFIISDFKSNIHLINPDGSEQKKWLWGFPENEMCNRNLVYDNSTNNIYFQTDVKNCRDDLKLIKFNLKNEKIVEKFIIRTTLLSKDHNKFMIDGRNRLIVLDRPFVSPVSRIEGNILKIITDSENILSLSKSPAKIRTCQSRIRCSDSETIIGGDVSINSDLISDMKGNIFIITHEITYSTITNLDREVIRIIDLSSYKKKYDYSDIKAAIDHNDILYFLFPREESVFAFDEHNICIAQYKVDTFDKKIFFNSQNELIVHNRKSIKIFRTHPE